MASLRFLDIERKVTGWMAIHYPDEQGMKDAKLGIPPAESRENTPFERQVVESFDRQIQIEKSRYTSLEGELFTKFQKILAQLNKLEAEYRRLRARVGDRDPQVRMHPVILLLLGLVSFAATSLMNKAFLQPLAEFDYGPILTMLGAMLAAFNVGMAYFSGRLIRQHRTPPQLTAFFAIVFFLFLTILFLVLRAQDYDPMALTVVVFNLVLLLLMAMASFMAHDTEPSYPRVKRQYDRQFKKAVALAGQRKHLHELFTKGQYAYVEGGQELIRAYRTSLQRHRPKEQIRILTEDIMPEFKTIEFPLQDPAGMTRFLEARVG